MKRTLVRSFFVATFLLLPLQYGLVGLGNLIGIGEPWPAVVQPGFQNVWDNDGAVTVLSPEFRLEFGDGGTESILPGLVFDDVPASHHLGIMRSHFKPAKHEEVDRATRMWLGDRFEELSGRRPSHANVIWYEVRVDQSADATSRTPVDTLAIEIPRK